MSFRAARAAILVVPSLLAAATGDVMAQNNRAADGCVIGLPPEKLHFDPFYKKFCVAGGIPIASSEKVPDAALQMAGDILTGMLGAMPAVREKLVAVNLRIAIIGEHEVTTDIPEYKPLKQMYPNRDYDKRTRGIGAMTAQFPITSGAEENLLCYPTDRYRGENIFVHEFSHTIKALGLQAIDPGFRMKAQQAYEHAKAAGLWANTYSLVNAEEYWAEGVESYFDVNKIVDPPNGIHNAIGTRAKLKDYDPALFELIDQAFHATSWRPRCP